jgi:hypothetical protein
MAKKRQDGLPGLDDRRWMPLGDDNALWNFADLVRRGLRVAYRERADDHIELTVVDPSQPPPYAEWPSKYFYYYWAPDLSALLAPPWSQEEERVRHKAGLKEEEVVFPPPPPRQRGRKPTADWKVKVAFYVGRIKGSGEELPTAAEIATWCGETLNCHPDIGDINKLLKTLRVQETRD